MIRELELRAFRSFQRESLRFSPGPQLLVGPNGSGKTGILEAISLFSPGGGLKGARLDEQRRQAVELPQERGDGDDMIQPASQPPIEPIEPMESTKSDEPLAGWDGSTTSLRAILEVGSGPVRIVQAFTNDNRRLIHIEGKIARQLDLQAYGPILWLCPEMDALLRGPKSPRRQFLDRCCASVDSDHARNLQRYHRFLRERGKVLQADNWDSDWLDTLEQQMCEAALQIGKARQLWAGQFRHELSDLAGDAPFGLELLGRPESDLATYADPDDSVAIEQALMAAWRTERHLDQVTGGARIGPHRSDVRVWMLPNRSMASCSTGQQKNILSDWMVGQARLVARVTGHKPVLLLDEGCAHLDRHHQERLFLRCSDEASQFFLSGTDPTLAQLGFNPNAVHRLEPR